MKKNKILMPLVSVALLFSLAACNGGGGSNSSGGGNGGGKKELRATLHFEDGNHDCDQAPYKDNASASDGKCVGRFASGDKETLTFTSDKAGKAELVATMYSSSAVSLYEVAEVTFNGNDLDIEEAEYEPDEEDESKFVDVSLGEVSVIAGKNILEFSFTDTSPYLDDLKVMSGVAMAIAVEKAPEKQTLTASKAKIELRPGGTEQITLTNTPAPTGVQYETNREKIATVSTTGLVTALTNGEAEITIKADGYYSTTIDVVISDLQAGEIRIEAESVSSLPSGFMQLTDRTSGINTGHSGGGYITGYNVTDEAELSYTFTSSKAQTMTLYIACSPAYNASEDFVFADSATIKVNNTEVSSPNTALLPASEAGMGAQTRDLLIGDVSVNAGENTFVIQFHGKAPALDCFKFIPKA